MQDPPLLQSVDGVLVIELVYRSSLDPESGDPRFCYETLDGLQSPTLLLAPGDEVFFCLSNQLPSGLDIPDTGFTGDLPANFSVCPHAARQVC